MENNLESNRRQKSLAQSALMISVFTLVSKFMGFLRMTLIASEFGSGAETDVYFAAMTATVAIMGALGTALNTTLIPIFSEIKAKKGKKGQIYYLNNIFNAILIVTIILAVLAYILSPYVIKFVGKGFKGAKFDMAVKLNRIGVPIMVLLGMTYVFSGFLQSNEIFGPHAIMGIPYNLVFLIFLIFFDDYLSIENLMIVTVIASSMQVLIQVPAVRHPGYRYRARLDLRDPYLKQALTLTLPVLLGSAIREINGMIDKALASELVEGSISALNYSARINDMVISVFVMAITTVVFPMLSQAFSENNRKKQKTILNQGVNIILLITVPATIGIIILAEPIVRVFFERNQFDALATEMTSLALVFYSVGLVAASLRLLLNRVFYSFHDTKTPMINGVIAVFLNVALNLLLIKTPLKHAGLALATSAAAIFTTILLFIDLRRIMGPIGLKKILTTFLKTFVSSLVMGVVVYLIYYVLGGYIIDGSRMLDFLFLILSVGVGVVIYFIMCVLLNVGELAIILREIHKRRIKKKNRK